MSSIADIRKEYKQHSLNENEVAADPITQFEKWWNQAMDSEINEVNAMTLATANLQAHPSARIVLLKGFDEKGFVFFTNYNSNKGIQLEENPFAALVFFWKELERQVRIEGTITKVDTAESDNYFKSRPRESKIGAWASAQSSVVSSRAELEKTVSEIETKYKDQDIPRPPHWGGYRVSPQLIEFWQGRPGRLHDRIRYTKDDESNWAIDRLAP